MMRTFPTFLCGYPWELFAAISTLNSYTLLRFVLTIRAEVSWRGCTFTRSSTALKPLFKIHFFCLPPISTPNPTISNLHSHAQTCTSSRTCTAHG